MVMVMMVLGAATDMVTAMGGTVVMAVTEATEVMAVMAITGAAIADRHHASMLGSPAAVNGMPQRTVKRRGQVMEA